MDRVSSLWGRLFSVVFALTLVSCASPGTEPPLTISIEDVGACAVSTCRNGD